MLKIIGAGFGRTGTLSLKTALHQLGFPCYHMEELFKHPEHLPYWDTASRGQPTDWDKLFEGYTATVDWPGAKFWRELSERYPEAKVVLTVRSPKSWYQSASETIFTVGRRFPVSVIARLIPPTNRMMPLVERIVHATFDHRLEDEAHCVAVFERHIEEVRRVIPAERLLVFEVKQGWGPLCAFLGVPEPSTPFPNVNDTAEFKKRIQTMNIISWALLLLPFELLALMTYMGWALLR
ncbi:MAG: hypothetical protein RIT28_1903 [Pseudomonadota bacterium]|jgi:hypothetical protein